MEKEQINPQEKHSYKKLLKLYHRGSANSEQIKVLVEYVKKKKTSGEELDQTELEILKQDERRKFLIGGVIGAITVAGGFGIKTLLNGDESEKKEKVPEIELPKIRTIQAKEKIQLSPEQKNKKKELITSLQFLIEEWKKISKTIKPEEKNNKIYDMIVKDFFYQQFPSLREQILKLYQCETSMDFYASFSKLKDCLLEYGLHIEIGAIGDDIIIETSEIDEKEIREISYKGKTSQVNIYYVNELKDCKYSIEKRIMEGWHQKFSNNILVNKNANQKGPTGRLLGVQKANNEEEEYFCKLMKEKLKEEGFNLENTEDQKSILEINQKSGLNHEAMHAFLEEHYFLPIMRKTGRINNKINLQKPKHQVELTRSNELKNFSIETIEIDEALANSYQLATDKNTNLLNYIGLILTTSVPSYNYAKKLLSAEMVKTPLCKNNAIKDVIKTMCIYPDINNLLAKIGENIFSECFQDLENYYKAVMSK